MTLAMIPIHLTHEGLSFPSWPIQSENALTPAKGKGKVIKNLASTLLAAGLILASGAAFAGARTGAGADRAQAQSAQRDCRPANGGEIVSGYAGNGDYIDSRTGESCDRR